MGRVKVHPFGILGSLTIVGSRGMMMNMAMITAMMIKTGKTHFVCMVSSPFVIWA
jgi:hypothetical protein